MDADDPRHGTYAGYCAHLRLKTKVCEPCSGAASSRRKAWRRRKAASTATTTKNYAIDGGYDENDGLGEGEWVLDRKTMTLRWEGELVMPVESTRTCHDCGIPVGPRFLRCRPCGERRKRRIKRDFMAKERAA